MVSQDPGLAFKNSTGNRGTIEETVDGLLRHHLLGRCCTNARAGAASLIACFRSKNLQRWAGRHPEVGI